MKKCDSNRVLAAILCMESVTLASVTLASVTLAYGALAYGALAYGQEVKDKALDFTQLTAPLEAVETNISNLEGSGHFRIVNLEYRCVGARGELAFVWTIVTKRSLTYRLAKFHLQQFRDVRFYVTSEKGRRELHSELLLYPERIESGAANFESLEAYMQEQGEIRPNESGRQEMLEHLVNRYL